MKKPSGKDTNVIQTAPLKSVKSGNAAPPFDPFKIDISTIKNAKLLNLVEDHMEKLRNFVNDDSVIREKSEEVADHLLATFKSSQAAVFAESEIIAGRGRKATNRFLAISPQSTDAYYVQEKEGGIYVRLEIKSVTQDKPSAIDKEIMNAEVQHKARLNAEGGKPTWHKTTILIGSKNNFWPCRTEEDFNYFNEHDPKQLLEIAEHRIRKLQMGSTLPSKLMRNKKTILSAQVRKAAEAQQKSEEIFAAVERGMSTPVKRGMPSSQSAADHSPKAVSAASPQAVTPRRGPLPPPPPSTPESEAILMRLRSGNIKQAAKPPQQLSPLSKQIQTRRQARKAELKNLAVENLRKEESERIQRGLLVTEQITVICPHLKRTYVLDRRADNFVAHFKTDPKPPNVVKRERRHWNGRTQFREFWRRSVETAGNTPLHQAILEGKVEYVSHFARNSAMNRENDNGDYPLHLACDRQNEKILTILIQNIPQHEKDKINITNRKGETALHIASRLNNYQLVYLLLSSGANLDKADKNGITPRNLINQSDDPNIRDLLAKPVQGPVSLPKK